jgi:hypothetical protein
MKHIRFAVASAVLVAGVVIPAAAGSAAYLSSPVSGSGGAGLSVSLTANTLSAPSLQDVVLTAVSSANVGPAGYALDIVDVAKHEVLASCATGSVCTAVVAERSGYHSYVAVVAKPDGRHVQATSAPVVVLWSGGVGRCSHFEQTRVGHDDGERDRGCRH